MKVCLLLLLIFIGFGVDSWAQTCIPEALTNSELNEFGDPITNSIDPDGSRQGDWIYQDTEGKPVFKEVYQNNELKASYFMDAHQAEMMAWKNSSFWTTNQTLHSDLLSYLATTAGELSANQQLLLLFTNTGELSRITFLGQWSPLEMSQFQSGVQSYLSDHQPLNLSNDTYLLF